MGDAVYDDVPDSLPPPSYEISQNEFDQKTSRVLEESAAEPPQPRVDDDGFEVWDDTVFEAALASMASLSVASSSAQEHASGSSAAPARVAKYPSEKARGEPELATAQQNGYPLAAGSAGAPAAAGSSSSLTRPLRLTKRRRPEKERPSWYQEAGLGASPPGAPAESRASSSSQPEMPQRSLPRAPRRQLTVFNNTGDVTEGGRGMTPPPEFTPVGPSLDGPPYETIVLSYDGPDLAPGEGVEEPEPPGFDDLPQSHTPRPPPSAPQVAADNTLRPHPVYSQTLPSSASLSTTPSPRPHAHHSQTAPNPSTQPHLSTRMGSDYAGAKHSSAPRVAFDPRMAYSKPLPAAPQGEEPLPQAIDASAFYSHAVASHFSANLPSRMRRQSLTTQSDRSSVYSQQWTVPQSSMGGYASSLDRVVEPPVVSPRPSYAYGQTSFQSGPGEPWNASGEQPWPPAGGGGSQHWR